VRPNGRLGARLRFATSLLLIGGKPVRLMLDSQDDVGDPKGATTAGQKRVDDNVAGVIGHVNSGATLPASKICSDAGVPEISPASTNSAYTRQGFKTAFRVIGDDHDVATVLTQYILERYKGKRIAVMDDRRAYGRSFSDDVIRLLKRQGVDAVGREYDTIQTIDFRDALTSLKSTRPGVIVYARVEAQAGPIRKQTTALGMGDVVLAGWAIETQQFITLAGRPATAEGTLSSESGYALADMPKGKDFGNRFAKYGPPVLFSPGAYDATWALIKAMQIAGSTNHDDVVKALHSVKFDGVTGEISFDATGNLRSARVTIFQVPEVSGRASVHQQSSE